MSFGFVHNMYYYEKEIQILDYSKVFMFGFNYGTSNFTLRFGGGYVWLNEDIFSYTFEFTVGYSFGWGD